MTAALAITKKELRSAFNSPVAYIVVTGIFTAAIFTAWPVWSTI